MKTTRRNFLASASAASAGLFLANSVSNSKSSGILGSATASAAEPKSGGKYKTKLYKATITGTPTDEQCEKWKAAGFDGVEVMDWNVSVPDARKVRQIAEKHDFRIHSVMRGWAEFNNKDKEVAQKTIDETKTALRSAAAYGASAILLVPCRVGGMAMPNAWDFDIDFDPKTLVVKTVAEGDNSKFAEYIEAQNYSTQATIKAIDELIPVAAEEGVMIAIENVWNNLWCTPEYAAALVKHFNNPWVKAYFDLGNHTKYSNAVDWIHAFGPELVKLHIKGYKVTQPAGKRGGGEGEWCNIDKASIDWKAVRKAIDDVNYNGWVSYEEGGYSDEKFNQILDDFILG
ncbi:MAG: sugar phosphate isomerase/epimerase family protein [Thermoguttaceae bacterium]